MTCNKTFKTWVEENSDYDYTPTEIFSFTANIQSNVLSVVINSISVTSDPSTSHINLLKYEGRRDALPLIISSDSAGKVEVLYNGISLGVATVDGINATGLTLSIPRHPYTITDVIVKFTSSDLLTMDTVYLYDDRTGTEWALDDIITDALITSDFSSFFNKYYKRWFVNGESVDLEDDLLLCWLSNKDKITEYATAMGLYDSTPKNIHQVAYGEHKTTNNLEDIMAQFQTDNDNTYGVRDVTENQYDYPITGASSSSSPSKASKSNTAQVTDENTITRYAHTDKHNRTITSNAHTDTTTDTINEEPNKALDSVKDITDLWVFMAEQFVDCFTLTCAMTW